MLTIARASVLLVLLAGFHSLAGAQINTGEIGGVVRDATGAAVPDAMVVGRHAPTGALVQRQADGQGRFFLPALRPGEWELTATVAGASSPPRRIVVEIGQSLSVDLTFSMPGISEHVTVEAFSPLLQPTTSEISDVFDNRQVAQFPLNGRNFISLAQLSDAVVLPPGGTRGDSLQQAGPLPNVGGQRSGHNIYLLDGTKVTDELFNNLVINPSVDSVQEFKIQKSMYPAEFGGKASALINVATKAGANVFHGSAFEFFRADELDAHNYFDAKDRPVPPLRQNQFGGSLGGRLVRDRTFFFGSYEGQRMERSLTRTFSVPNDAVRGGDFSGLAPICDPLTVAPSGTCQPFAGNRIPASRIDPIAAAFLERVPRATSNAAVQNLTSVEQLNRNLDQASVRVDHRLTDRDQLFVRFSTFDADELQPFGTSVLQETPLGADNATVRNVPEPGPGSIQARRDIPQLSRINAIRFDGKSIYHGVTFKVERRLRNNYAFSSAYTWSSSIDDASSPGATEAEANVPQNVRNVFSEDGNGRVRASIAGTSSS